MVAADYHIPVLCEAAVSRWYVRPGGFYVDATAGGGGHTRRLLEIGDPDLRLIAIDQDEEALAQLPDDPRLSPVHDNFENLGAVLDRYGIHQVDGILADLGVSSHHFDTPERGFSFRFDGSLDMRMNATSNAPTAAELLNEASVFEIKRWFREYGELHQPGKLARAVESRRHRAPILTTTDLNATLEVFAPARHRSTFLAQVYQALRMAVNREVDVLESFLTQAVERLRSGGALVVLSYHSLEDRRVKHLFRSGNLNDEAERDFYGNPLTPWRETSRKAVAPDEEEIERNPRARSARLRYGVKA